MTPPPGPSPRLRHPERDPDLLLLAHRALPPVSAALTRLHLIRCADCRHRLGALRAASHALAAAIHDPGLARWSPPSPIPSGTAITAWTLLAATVMLAIVLISLAVHNHRQTPALAPLVGGPCRPDLPNDHCR